MSTGCEFYEDALVDLAEGRLEAARVKRVESHLETCAECREALTVIRAVGAAPAPMPDGLEARIQAALQDTPATERAPDRPPARMGSTSRWSGWQSWALPVAAAAAVALWIGGSQLMAPGPESGTATDMTAAEYDPYGAWPASDGEVAGDLVLSELSLEELEALLEEMQ